MFGDKVREFRLSSLGHIQRRESCTVKCCSENAKDDTNQAKGKRGYPIEGGWNQEDLMVDSVGMRDKDTWKTGDPPWRPLTG